MSDVAVPRVKWTEDLIALVAGLLVFALALPNLAGIDLLGWAVTTSVWTDAGKGLGTVSKAYADIGGLPALLLTYLALLAILSAAAAALKVPVARFVLAFTALFAIAYACWFLGSFAHLAVVTPADQKKFGIDWSLKLTNEGGFIVALVAGLLIANFAPLLRREAERGCPPRALYQDRHRHPRRLPGGHRRRQAEPGDHLLLRGTAAIVEAYLIYWSVVYFIARKYFGFSREWSVPLASGISICGVAAAIATGGAIRARPAVPILVSSLVVIFAVVEVLILPWVAQTFLADDPLVAGAWIGLAIKTDGAARRGGRHHRLVDLAKAGGERRSLRAGLDSGHHRHGQGVHRHLHRHLGLHPRHHLDQLHHSEAGRRTHPGPRDLAALPPNSSWASSPLSPSLCCWPFTPRPTSARSWPPAIGEANVFRVIFFLLTFFSIGLLSNFKKLWQGGLRQAGGRLSGQPVRLRDLGRAGDFLDLLPRRAAANRLVRNRSMSDKILQDELAKAGVEPLLPIEKKLIGWSLGLGLVLLVILGVISRIG